MKTMKWIVLGISLVTTTSAHAMYNTCIVMKDGYASTRPPYDSHDRVGPYFQLNKGESVTIEDGYKNWSYIERTWTFGSDDNDPKNQWGWVPNNILGRCDTPL
jgi:hypothetical protein